MPDKQEFLYQEIAEAIRQRIAAGDLSAGDRLPTVRDLARDWSCTPGTVSRAYKALRDEGLLVSYRGRGTLVAENILLPTSGREGQSQDPKHKWAVLVNRADQYLLDATASGYTAEEAEGALSVAVSRWRAIDERSASSTPDSEVVDNLLRFAGSHDILLERVASLLREGAQSVEFEMSFVGSLGGLMALLRGEAGVAGTHLWDRETDGYNEAYVERLFPGERVVLMTLSHRSLGLLFQRERVGELNSPAAIAERHLRLVNRQRGSGTRLWLDSQFSRLAVDASTVPGYDSELTTHMAVAKRVAAGEADVGPGIYAAAAAYGLDFLALARERYDLVFFEKSMSLPTVQALVSLVQSAAFRRTVETMGGYDAEETGRMRVVGR